MKYLKVFVDFAEAQEALNDAEFGRLIRAMVKYVSDGSTPDLRGNERYAWGSAKLSIDQQSGSYSNKVAGAAKAREARSDIRVNQNDIRNKNLISTQEQEQEQDYKKKNYKKKKLNPALNYQQSPIPEKDFNAMVVDLGGEA